MTITVQKEMINGYATFPFGFGSITGFVPSAITGTSTTASITISAGSCTDSTNTAAIISAGNSWAVSNGNAINGYQGGTTLPNSSTIHMYECTGNTGTGSFASTSLTPTLPSGYNTYYRRIFSFFTNGAGAPVSFTAIEITGGALLSYLTTQVQDVNVAAAASRSLGALSVPTGIKVQVLGRGGSSGAAANFVLFTSPDETDVAVPSTPATAPAFDGVSTTAFNSAIGNTQLTTDTSGRIGYRANTTGTNIVFYTRGNIDWRR